MHWEDTPLDGFGREPPAPETALQPDSHDVRWADAGLDALTPPPLPPSSTSIAAPVASTSYTTGRHTLSPNPSYTHALQRFVRCVGPPTSHLNEPVRGVDEAPSDSRASRYMPAGWCVCRVASVSASPRAKCERPASAVTRRAERVRRGSAPDGCGCRGTAQLTDALAHELQAAETAQTAQLRWVCLPA